MTAGINQPGMDELFAATYDELRRLASAVKGRDKSVTLNPTALVHEAWIKLSASSGMKAVSELHFKRGGANGTLLLTTDRFSRSAGRGGWR